MQTFTGSLEALAEQNDDFRRVVFTAMHSQLVAMVLPPGEEIGLEHHDGDQIFLLVDGTLAFDLDGRREEVGDGGIVVVPAGVHHNVTNVGRDVARLVTVYAPAEHAAGTVHHTRNDAIRAELALRG
jgi:mannose-6-phosphate isomerase-like protein (cupin superfamily)